MAHIDLPPGVPGILGPLKMYPETEGPISDLTQVLLRGPSPLTPAERELIATYVSCRNQCSFCTQAHGATARHLLGDDAAVEAQVRTDFREAPISEKLKALLVIAGKVQESGLLVTDEDVARARDAGADDRTIHDTVLLAAAFCMFNRYVDGLGTWTPEEPEIYEQMGQMLAEVGYSHEVVQAA
jgi:uncharacterized peroxidase-related enzyme